MVGGGGHVAVGAGGPQEAAGTPGHAPHVEAGHVVTQISLGQAGLFIFVVLRCRETSRGRQGAGAQRYTEGHGTTGTPPSTPHEALCTHH